jgi:LacI family transcriptional regulator
VSKPATIYDVAKVAGVSHQTVSRFLKGYEGIRPTTRERVIRALDELDYRPNLTARSLKSGRSHRIAALTHEINQVGPSRIVQGASVAARQSGFLLDIVTLDMSDRAAIDDALKLVAQLDVAGLIALASTDEMADAFEHAEFRVPAFVAADDESAGQLSELSTIGIPALISHLAEFGHQRLLHIAGPSTWSAARNRARAFDSALDARGLASAGHLVGDWSASSGYDAITRMPTLGGATAIVAANDQMALGAILALTERGLAVPEDVSVTGVDDIPEAAFFRPPLTTLRIDFEAQGKAAVDQLLERIGHSAPAASAAPTPLLVTRQSTGPVSS